MVCHHSPPSSHQPVQFRNEPWRGSVTQVVPEMRGARPHIHLTTCTSLTLAPEAGEAGVEAVQAQGTIRQLKTQTQPGSVGRGLGEVELGRGGSGVLSVCPDHSAYSLRQGKPGGVSTISQRQKLTQEKMAGHSAWLLVSPDIIARLHLPGAGFLVCGRKVTSLLRDSQRAAGSQSPPGHTSPCP